MRVAFVSNVVYPFVTGGAEKRIHEIGTRLADEGHDVTIYGRHFWDGPEQTTHEGMTLRAVAPEADLYDGDRRSITEALDFAARALPQLRRHLRRDEHDVVVASVFPYFPVLATKLASLRTETPLVTTWHEVWNTEYWVNYLGILGLIGWIVQLITANVPQRPIAVSEMTADRLARIRLDRRDIEVVPNGVNVEEIDSTPASRDTYDILYVGRLISDKNVGMLLKAFDEISNTHEVSLGIIGDGPKRDALETQAESLVHPERVDFLGFLEDSEDVYSYMSSADLFVLPSTREGFGITVLEAMVNDCIPIVVSHEHSAASEVVGRAGFVAEPTPSSLAEKIERVLAGKSPEVDPVERARQFDWEVAARHAEQLYTKTVD